MIRSFRDKRTEKLFHHAQVKGFPPEITARARRKMVALDSACSLDDMRVPPSNRLEILKGNRSGQYSVRINDQWRICFRWVDGDAFDVEICDYH